MRNDQTKPSWLSRFLFSLLAALIFALGPGDSIMLARPSTFSGRGGREDQRRQIRSTPSSSQLHSTKQSRPKAKPAKQKKKNDLKLEQRAPVSQKCGC